MIASWMRRTADLHRELRAIAALGVDPRWWLLAGGAAVEWDVRQAYIISDAEPCADTFIGHVAPAPAGDVFVDAVQRALAARDAIRALDGRLPDQPLAVTLKRTTAGAVTVPSALDVAAFAIGEHTWVAPLGGRVSDLAADLARAASGGAPRIAWQLGAPRLGESRVPFACVTIGDEPLATARHGHRRAWLGNGSGWGPWLGLSRAGELAVVSTSHMVLDGFGHTWLAERIRATLADRTAPAHAPPAVVAPPAIPHGAVALDVAWRPLAGPPPSALTIAYALGRVLHRIAGRRDAAFSPTFQIPVAPGAPGDPERRKRRVVPAIASVRFDGGAPEPFASFATRTRALLHREAAGSGPSAQLLAAAQAAPAPLAWKRKAVGAHRPGWLDAVATLVGGRGCVSRIRLDSELVTGAAPACAVSSPGRLPTDADPLGGCVVTVVDDGERGAITLCGAGFVDSPARADELLGELLALLPS